MIIIGNSATIGVIGEINLVKTGCVLNNVIKWKCGATNATITAENHLYFPNDCQSFL